MIPFQAEMLVREYVRCLTSDPIHRAIEADKIRNGKKIDFQEMVKVISDRRSTPDGQFEAWYEGCEDIRLKEFAARLRREMTAEQVLTVLKNIKEKR